MTHYNIFSCSVSLILLHQCGAARPRGSTFQDLRQNEQASGKSIIPAVAVEVPAPQQIWSTLLPPPAALVASHEDDRAIPHGSLEARHSGPNRALSSMNFAMMAVSRENQSHKPHSVLDHGAKQQEKPTSFAMMASPESQDCLNISGMYMDFQTRTRINVTQYPKACIGEAVDYFGDNVYLFNVSGVRISLSDQSGGNLLTGEINNDGNIAWTQHDQIVASWVLVKAISDSRRSCIMDAVIRLVSGTGTVLGTNGFFEYHWLNLTRVQSKAVLLVLSFAYFLLLWTTASFAYKQTRNNSPITYYADPRQSQHEISSHDIDAFLEEFNQSPREVHLQVSGWLPKQSHSWLSNNSAILAHLRANSTFQRANISRANMDSYLGDAAPRWTCSLSSASPRRRLAFAFSLDLSSWAVPSLPSDASRLLDGVPSPEQTEASVEPEDRAALRAYLASDTNDLGTIVMVKEISWPRWDELATNIKTQIRQCGFQGEIHVSFQQLQHMQIYKNTHWANFMHCLMVKVVVALTVVGWLVYLPYMYARCRPIKVRCRHHIDISIDNYWTFVADRLCAHGFQLPDGPQQPAQESQPFPAFPEEGERLSVPAGRSAERLSVASNQS